MPEASLRLDKWLWHARFFKTRTLAAKTVTAGRVRVNGNRVEKSSTAVRVGDGLTFAQGNTVRVVRILALGTRRGPAPEAQALYDDLTPDDTTVPKRRVGRRPTKRDRRILDAAAEETASVKKP